MTESTDSSALSRNNEALEIGGSSAETAVEKSVSDISIGVSECAVPEVTSSVCSSRTIGRLSVMTSFEGIPLSRMDMWESASYSQ